MAISETWEVVSTPKRLRPGSQASASSLKSVGTALDVLECFATDGALGVSDIARHLGIAKSTAHRVLTTLASRGFIEQDESGQYRLGMHLYELGQLALGRNELRHAALPTLREVARTTGHTVNFGVPDGGDVVFVERIETLAGVRILGHVGRRLPAHCTSSGKALAAYNPEVDRQRRLAGFPPRVRGTVRRLEDWERELAVARGRGFAVAHDESFDGVTSIAVPVMSGNVAVAAISVFGPTEALSPDLDRLVPLLKAASCRISKAYRR